ncbi:MAG: hypothetical protein H0U55_07300 [Rubrobacteraceae bacterium]|nr:hypothetical protein [Rubrobacteraceae bacterium]
MGAEYLPNLFGPAIGALKAYQSDEEDDVELRGETTRDADVAVRLLRDAVGGDPVVALLRWEAPGKVERLEKFLAEDAVDASEASKALRALQVALSDDLVPRALTVQLGYGENADLAVLQGAVVVLACRNVGRFAESQMKRLLKQSFARSVPFALLEEHAERIRRDEVVSDSIEVLEMAVVREAVGRDEASGGDPEHADLYFLFGGDRAWRRSAYRLVSLARRLWTEELGGRVRGAGEPAAGLGEAVYCLLGDRAAQSRMAREIVVRFAAYAFQKRFRRVVLGEGRGTDPILAEAATALERVLGEIGVSNRSELAWEDPESFPPTTSRSAFALSAALPIALSEACADGYVSANADLVKETSERLGERLTELLAEEPGGTDPPDSDGNEEPADPETVCATWSARRRLHVAAGEVLAELAPSLEEHLRRLSQQERPARSSGSEDRFWAVWRRNYAGEAFHSSWMPWGAVGEARVLERAVAEATSRFGGVPGDYLVVFRVEGIRPQGLKWRMADVTFYDPELFYYGEGPDLGPAAENLAGNEPAVCYAAVRVVANTSAEAVRSARQHLIAGLDCYSFGLSGNPLRGDFNPSVMDWEYVVSLSEESGGFNYERPVPFQEEQRAADLDLPGMARAYSALLAKAAGDPRRLTQLQDRFVRAVHWLREARFDADPAKRFVLYYVGLEHIFARGEGSDAVGRRVPRLNKTWRNIGNRLIFPGMAFRRVHEMVQQDAELRAIADADVRLRRWEQDERVLFDPEKVRTLLDLIPETREEARRSASVLLEDLQSLRADAEWIGADVERLRDL